MSNLKTWVSSLLVLVPQLAGAATLSAPFTIQTAGVLPAGISNPEFDLIMAPVEQKYDSLGVVQPLGAPLNQSVRWNQVVAAQPTDAQKASVVSVLASAGITDLSTIAGQTTGEVNTYTTAFVPVFKYGLTDRISLGVAVPIVRRSLSTATGFIGNDSARSFIRAAGEASSPAKAAEAAAQLNQAVPAQLAAFGYKPLVPRTVSAMGDVRIGAKYLVSHDETQSLSVKPEISLATGSRMDPDEVIDLSTGTGELGLSMTVNHDLRLLSDLSLSTYATYLYQKPDDSEQRIPFQSGMLLSPDKEVVARKIGDQIRTGAALGYSFPTTGLTLAGGYNLSYLAPSRYSGTRFSAERYGYLEGLNPSNTLHSGIVALNFSSVGFYRRKEMAVPFQATVNYSFPIAGRNAYFNKTINTEMVMFF